MTQIVKGNGGLFRPFHVENAIEYLKFSGRNSSQHIYNSGLQFHRQRKFKGMFQVTQPN